MNQEKKLLLIIILSVFAILMAVHLTSCSSTKKAVKDFAQVIKKDESKSSDSVVTKSKDSTSTKQSTNKTVTTDSSGYEKETEETIIEWIVMDTTKPGKQKENTKMKVTKKVIKEKGRKNTNVISEQSKADSTSLKQHDSAAITKDSSGSMLSDTRQSSKDKQVKKAFPGWAWMVGILVALSGVGWFFKEKLYLLFPFLKRKNDTKG